MKLESTNKESPAVTFKEALIQGLAPDKGLYMPKDALPVFSIEDLESHKGKEYHEIAFDILKKILKGEIEEGALEDICKDAYNFEVPLEKLDESTYIMRLDQGPTASFKDFAARMMARLIEHYLKGEDKEMTILTATSGDTGSAVAHAFYNLKNIRVVVLYPKDEVSDRQRKQMTTLGKNITAISVDGKFDDCQAMVKKAFSDHDLGHLNLSSANSINIGRLIPQTIYYFYAYSRLDNPETIIFSIPSGNFGNMMGCVLAKKMGLPVKKIIAAVNENNEVPVFLKTGIYKKIVPSKNCLSNAMNVGHPSNFARVISFYGGEMDEKGIIKKMPELDKLLGDLYSISVTDEQTKMTIRTIYEKHKTVVEPHGAVGLSGLESYRKMSGDDSPAVCLETAHPAKFPLEIVKLTGVEPEVPDSLLAVEGKEEHVDSIGADYSEFKCFLLEKFL